MLTLVTCMGGVDVDTGHMHVEVTVGGVDVDTGHMHGRSGC